VENVLEHFTQKSGEVEFFQALPFFLGGEDKAIPFRLFSF